MTNQNNEIKFALEFPQGHMLFMKKDKPSGSDDVGAVYFQPRESTDAFSVEGERKELFGRHAICVEEDKDTGAAGYGLVYEHAADGDLVDARLITDKRTVYSKYVDEEKVRALNKALAQNEITLHGCQEPDTVFNAARFSDGRLLIQLSNNNELYLGTSGDYQKLDARVVRHGGNSMIYALATGEFVELPYGFGGPQERDIPKFKGEELVYLDIETRADHDPAKYGLDLSSGIVHLGPFSPQLPPLKMITGPFNHNAEDNPTIEYIIPPHVGPRQAFWAGRYLQDMNKGDIEFNIYGVDISIDEKCLAGMQRTAEVYEVPAAITSFLMGKFSAATAFVLPRPATALEASYPFRSKALEAFLVAPHDNADFSVLKEKLAVIQEQYIDYLFDTLKKASSDNASELFDDCFKKIYENVVNNIPNSQAYLTDERRTLLIDELTKNNKITEGLSWVISTEGIGPSAWKLLDEEARRAPPSGPSVPRP